MMAGKIKPGKGRGKARKHTKKYRIRVTGPGFRFRANRYRPNELPQEEPEWGERAEAWEPEVATDRGGVRPRRTRGPAKKHKRKVKKASKRTRKLTKAERRAISIRNLKKAHAALRKKSKGRGKAKKHHKKAHRGRASNPFRRISYRIGGRTRKSYLYRTRTGKVRHLPEFALLGYRSQKARERAAAKPGGPERIQRRWEAIMARRQRAAAKAPQRIMAGKDIFSPNAGKIVSFEEWKKMNANKKRKKSRKGKKGRVTRKQLAASRRNIKKAQAARRRGKHTKRGKSRKHRITKGHMSRKQLAASRRNIKKAQAARRRGKGRKHAKGRKHVARRRRSFRFATGRSWTMRATPARRGRGKRRGRRGMVSIHLRRNYRANFGGALVHDLTRTVKVGALVLSGYVVHRALTTLLDNYGTSKIAAVANNNYRKLISSAVVALVGIPGTIYLGKKARVDVAPVLGGMAASFLHGALLAILNAAGQTSSLPYLSGYADGGGRAYRGMGEYYSFKPRQVFNGMGEFYEVLPQSGFGLDTAQLRQAAGSYPMEAVGFTQAPGGMGAAVTQAAGAAGEYIVYGAEGMGDYEEVVPTGSGVATNDGIRPNLHEAEMALNVVEAAGAMGDLPLQMNVDPTVAQRPVAGEPGGSRAGILAGGDGIFG